MVSASANSGLIATSGFPTLNVLKMNLEEAQASWFKKEYESSDFTTSEEPDRAMLRAFGEHCCTWGLKAVYITVDSRGSLVYYRKIIKP